MLRTMINYVVINVSIEISMYIQMFFLAREIFFLREVKQSSFIKNEQTQYNRYFDETNEKSG